MPRIKPVKVESYIAEILTALEPFPIIRVRICPLVDHIVDSCSVYFNILLFFSFVQSICGSTTNGDMKM